MSTFLNIILILAMSILHIYIIKGEYIQKKILNKYLIGLIGINISYILFHLSSIHTSSFLLNFLFFIFLLLGLYYLKIWSPSYIKYIGASSILFLGSGGIFFVSNIFFLILLYLIFYFVFYYIKLLFLPKELLSRIHSLRLKTLGDIQDWSIKNKNRLLFRFFQSILGFISLFIGLRLFRFYIQGEFNYFYNFFSFSEGYINIVVLFVFLIFILSLIVHRKIKKYFISSPIISWVFIIFTGLFLLYEYKYDYFFISQYLHKIFTFYMIIMIISGIIIKMGKYLFFDNDSKVISYTDLQPGNIIDKKFVSSYLVGQQNLSKYDIPSFLKGIKNPLNSEDCDTLKKYILMNSDYQKKHGRVLPPNVIQIYNTFLFSPFIFGSVIVTLFTSQNLLINFILLIFNKIISFS